MAAMYFPVVLFTLSLFIPRGDSLGCYKCTSLVSWEDCNSKMTKITCPSGSSQCLNGTLNCTSGDKKAIIYYKSCGAPNKNCEIANADLPHCPRSVPAWHFSHSENCCSGDYCNSDEGASDSLSCHKCTSKSSWEDCNSQMTKITCPSGSSQCLKGTLNCTSGDIKAIFYYKHCSAPNKTCEIAKEDLPHCPRSVPAWHFSHSESCCSGDNCNVDLGDSYSTSTPTAPTPLTKGESSQNERSRESSRNKRSRAHSLALSINGVILATSTALILWAV